MRPKQDDHRDDHDRQRRQRPGAARCSRGAQGRPRGRPVHLAGLLAVAERRAQPRSRSRTSSASARSRPTRPSSTFDADHPAVFAAEDNGITPDRVPARRPGQLPLAPASPSVAQNRGIQLRSVEATVEGHHDIRGILGADSDVRNGFNDITVQLQDRRRRHAAGDRGAGRPVAEALRGLRRPDQPDRRDRRGCLSTRRRARVVVGAGHAGLAASHFLAAALDRPRRPRARGGGELLAARALGLAAAAHAELADPAAGPRLRRAGPRRLHDERPRWSRSSTASRRARRRRSGPARRSRRRAPYRRRVRRRDRRGHPARPDGRASPAAPATGRPCRRSRPSLPASMRAADPVRLPQPRPARRRRRAGRRAPRRPASSSPPSCSGPAGR